MKRSFETRNLAVLPLALFAGSLPLSAAASAHNIKASSVCKGIEFAAPKGGPGIIDVEVFPVTRGHVVASLVMGKVIKGNDKGALISSSTNFPGAGEFSLTWDETSHKTQNATVSLSLEVPGHAQLQECPDTTLHFDPNSFHISPALPKS